MKTPRPFFMPSIADFFYGPEVETDKRLLRVPTKDYELIRTVFPEAGVTTHLTVYVFQKIASQLRKDKITTYKARTAKGINLQYLKDCLE